MRILALQLKRIGDLILTTPALHALKSSPLAPGITLAVHTSTAGLLPAISAHDEAIVFGPGRGWAPWQQVLTGKFDIVLDFTGTDRSALAAVLSRASRRIAFSGLKKKRLRALAHREFVDSDVRGRHTIDHYLDLLRPLGIESANPDPKLEPDPPSRAGISDRPRASELLDVGRWMLDVGCSPASPAVLHPGTARPEKNWLPARWSEVAAHLREHHGLPSVATTGPGPADRAAAESIGIPVIAPPDLCAFASVIARAPLVVSCDTAAVHLAAAFQRPQIALFGPTNPFHWRPRHPRAVVLSAAQPDAPMTGFSPRMKGAPMDRISTALVCRAIDDLLARAS